MTKQPRLLQTLPIPYKCCSSYGIDFITNLLEKKEGYNTTLTITERLINYTQFIPCRMSDYESSALQVAEVFFKHVVCKFGISEEIVSDRDRSLCQHSGNICGNLWAQKHLCPQLFIPKQMAELKE